MCTGHSCQKASYFSLLFFFNIIIMKQVQKESKMTVQDILFVLYSVVLWLQYNDKVFDMKQKQHESEILWQRPLLSKK